MTKTFKVKNFEKFQHYKDRSPPWIKLYYEVLEDYQFGLLSDSSKAHLMGIWLLASRLENTIPYDAAWVSRRVNANSPVNLGELENAGFIIANQTCSETLASCKQSACPETETETETEGGAHAPASVQSTIVQFRRYEFEGRIIRLTTAQYEQWRTAYPNIPDLRAKLQYIDDYYADMPPKDGKWFFRVSRWLERDNADIPVKGSPEDLRARGEAW